jgi:Asp-tRNA(Asn)/Glu-tRNA(Gln) amidotransferase A subunit family amidase
MPFSPGRRRFAALLAGLGVAHTALPETLWGLAQDTAEIGDAQIVEAARLLGLEFTPEERALMLEGVRGLQRQYAEIREVRLDNGVAPALRFEPLARPGNGAPSAPIRPSRVEAGPRPGSLEELAFLPVTHLSELVRTRQVGSLELTRMYLARLKRYDPQLHCVITLTEERALEQARRADRELRDGIHRGPLHGIPWGAKDLLAVRGYPTTWGARPFEGQVLDEDATVVRKLDEAGAVLVAKLSLGALAWGDVWFDARTRNPWNPELGSSGSSAGPAAATAAGLVGFSIGSETWGSIVSPSVACGATGLRPTFGRVSRHGAMALAWSMDKIGPICRDAEDCALVFDAIRGADGRDATVQDGRFEWDPDPDLSRLRVGVLASVFDSEPELPEDFDETARRTAIEQRQLDREALAVLGSLGVELVPVDLPDLPVSALSFILSAEAAAAFDELTRSGRDELLVRQVERAWPNVFRQARLIPAVEYIQANRIRTMVMLEMEMLDVDVYLTPTFGGDNLLLTNLTGHPCVVLPNGFEENGSPTSITFMGRLYGDDTLLAVAKVYQDATDFNVQHPPMFQ